MKTENRRGGEKLRKKNGKEVEKEMQAIHKHREMGWIEKKRDNTD